jgi:NAD(P)-dependent dehydrogenase (short-subunit alcohol dehydrogenase family)
MDSDKNLNGKVAVVTGGSQGLGRVIAHQLADEGCKVIINFANNQDNANSVIKEITNSGGFAEAFRCDISDENSVRQMADDIAAKHGSVGILVNNARMDPYRRKPEMSEGEWWDMVMSVNLKGTYLASLIFFEQMKKEGYGRMVNISSVRSFIPAEMNMIGYGVSKLGMHGITRAFADNGAEFGVTANTVAPGMIITENIEKRLTEEMKQRELNRIPLRRAATSEEIAESVIFAIKSGYITGETININGGMYYAP